MNSEIIIVDSFNKTNLKKSNFSVPLNKTLRNVKQVELLHCSFSNIFDVFSNNRFYFFDNGTEKSFQIPDGQYSVTEIVDFIQTNMNSLSTGYIVTYSETSFKISVQNTNPALFFQLLFSKEDSPYRQLGSLNLDTALGNVTFKMPNAINLDSTDLLFINIAQLGNTITHGAISASFVVPVTVPRGSVQTFNKNSFYEQKYALTHGGASIDTFDISLYNDRGRLVSASSDIALKLVLKVYYD